MAQEVGKFVLIFPHCLPREGVSKYVSPELLAKSLIGIPTSFPLGKCQKKKTLKKTILLFSKIFLKHGIDLEMILT